MIESQARHLTAALAALFSLALLRRGTLSLALLVALMVSLPGWAAGPEARLIFVGKPEPKSALVHWKATSFPVEENSERNEPKQRFSVVLEGTFQRRNSSLLIDAVEQKPAADGQFQSRVMLSGPATVFSVHAVDPFGKVTEELYKLEVAGQVFGKRPLAEGRRRSVSLGLGYTTNSFEDTRYENFTQQALTVKAAYTMPILDGPLRESPWDIGISGYFSVLPISTTSPTKLTARFLGINGRIGYKLPFLRAPWTISLLTGWYWTTMFAGGEPFGFDNMAGPQLFPTLRFAFSRDTYFTGYFKFSPVFSGVLPLSLSNREVAIGGALSHLTGSRTPLSVTFDIAHFQLLFGQEAIRSRSITFGFAIGL